MAIIRPQNVQQGANPWMPNRNPYGNYPQTAGGRPPPNLPGGPQPPNPAPYLDALYSARSGLVGQQQNLLKQYGGSLRQALFAASPELAQASQYLQESYAKPIPDSLLKTYRENIQSAQASRGFEGGGAPAQAEAMELTNLAEQRRMQLLPQLEQFGSGILQAGGLAAPQTPGLSDIAALNQQQLGYSQLAQSQYEFQQQLAFQQRQFDESLMAAREQSDFARQQYKDTQSRIDEFDKFARKPNVQSLREDYKAQQYQQYLRGVQSGGYGSPFWWRTTERQGGYNLGNVSGF